MKGEVTDKDVQKRIDYMREKAGSDDMHAMVRAWMEHHCDGYYWYGRVKELVGKTIFLFLLTALAALSAMCFYFYIATTLPPLVSGLVGAAVPIAALGLAVYVMADS